MKKICFFNINAYSAFHPESVAPIGGTEIQLFNVSRFLADSDDFDVSFVTGDWGQMSIEEFGEIRIYKSFSLDMSVVNYFRAPFLMWRKLKYVDAEVYIASSAGAEIGILALFCKVYRKKFIYRTAHQIDCDGEYSRGNGWKGRMYDFGLRRADVIVTQNVDHQRLLAEKKLQSIVIRNSFIIHENESVGGKGLNVVLWVSRCEEWKNPDLFLDIVERLPNVKFCMICPRSNNQEKLFQKISERARNLRNLDFKEGVLYSEIQHYFDTARIFIGTSEYEGFPNTYVQACIGQTPIISYKVNPDQFISNNNVGCCVDGDFERMINCVDLLLKDDEDWKEKSGNAFRYVKENHDIGVVGKQWINIINGL